MPPADLTADDGAYFVVWGRWGARDVRVAVAQAPRAAQVEARGPHCRSGHGGVMHGSSQPPRTWRGRTDHGATVKKKTSEK